MAGDAAAPRGARENFRLSAVLAVAAVQNSAFNSVSRTQRST
jgi:hypothetical protein